MEAPMNIEPTKISIEWMEARDGIALYFDKQTWKVFETVANLEEQSAKHMITRAVVGCLGSILEDNMVLNQILRGSS
jgi:hypothetical protein